jgi:hypothetical protein
MSIIRVSCALFVGVVFAASSALCQVQTRSDYTLPEQPTLRVPEAPRRFAARLALLGANRQLYDLSLNAIGVEGSIGGEGQRHGGYANLHLMRGESTGHLTFTEFGLTGTYEIHQSGLRLGVGGGLTNLSIIRATTGSTISSTGLESLIRIGYDFSEPSGLYLLGQVDFDAYKMGDGGGTAWGPTLYGGWRF